jgi:hypothetical protein
MFDECLSAPFSSQIPPLCSIINCHPPYLP